MNYYNKIAPLHYRLLALGLLLFFVVPPVLKTLHSYEFHSAQKDCEHSTTHLHSSSIHNDALDYYFQVLAEADLNSYNLDELLFFNKNTATYQSSLYNSNFHFSSTRGPPYF